MRKDRQNYDQIFSVQSIIDHNGGTDNQFPFQLWLASPSNNPKYWAWSNGTNPDKMPHNAVSDHGPHCLLFIQQFLDTRSEMLWTF